MFRRSTRITTTTVEAPAETSWHARDKFGPAPREAWTSLAAAVGPTLVDAREKIGPAVDDALDKIAPVVADARERLVPVVEDARDRIAPVMSDARDKVGPLAGSALIAGKARGRQAAYRLGLAEEPQPEPKTHKIRNLLLLLGLGGAAAFAYKKITGKDADPAWTASRDSASASHADYGSRSPAPDFAESESGTETVTVETTSHLAAADAPPLSTDAPDDQSDTAPSAPFPSEETVESHEPTTPDEPLEKKDL
ncbi:MAG: hypothetical protein H0T14_05625 [Nocardioidaceae bacterium]|nr:hypothetical protein [Nocardioidaceae bacterium]